MENLIPLSVPNLSGNEWKYIKECLDTNWVSSVGSFVDKFEKDFAEYVGAKYAVSVVNGTAALHMALQIAGVEQNDYVIAPNITFIASINAIKYCYAFPILIDVLSDTWQMDVDLLEDFLKNNTYQENDTCYLKENKRRIKAIMPVHVLGNMCEMDKIMQLAEQYKLSVIEDSTEALGSFYKNQHAGTFGKMGCFSFNGNKIMTTGGGGMIVTNDEKLAKRAKHLTTQAKSDSFEYIHDDVGYNYRLVNILAAMGVAQLEQMPDFLKRKKEIHQYYTENLKNLPLSFQKDTENSKPNYWLFTICIEKQKELMTYLIERKIQVRPFWRPMNMLDMFKNDIYVSKEDNAFKIYEKSVSLPCSTNITDQELEKVVQTVRNFYQ
ncbi:MAG: LegC family aminotransferase [Raineya sp.]|jgi:perosamine synthetase|nr:LegC family aminotransferase [Raineya sp.]